MLDSVSCLRAAGDKHDERRRLQSLSVLLRARVLGIFSVILRANTQRFSPLIGLCPNILSFTMSVVTGAFEFFVKTIS